MSAEWLAVGLALGATLWLALGRRGRRGQALALGLPLVGAFAAGLAAPGPAPAGPPDAPIQVLTDGYVSSDTCASCHPQEHASWAGSFHRTMTQAATPASTRADFDGVEVAIWGQRFALSRRGDELWVDMPDPLDPARRFDREGRAAGAAARRVERRVALVTGSHHYQVFWVPQPVPGQPEGRALTNLSIVYLIEEDRWIPREAAFLSPPEIGQGHAPWSMTCLRCHVTRGRPGRAIDTDFAELGIACEACHGPAEAHVERYRDPLRRYWAHLVGDRSPAIAEPGGLDHRRSSEVCAHCHSLLAITDGDEFMAHGTAFRPGEDLRAAYPSLLGEGMDAGERAERLWADGEVRVTGREYVAMSASRCFGEGELGCLSCHSMHGAEPDDQLRPGMRGDAACTGCHAAASYAAPAHTHHAAGSSGAECQSCHMPYSTYGLLKAVRSHRIGSPRVTDELRSGRPNACNLCHLDRPLGWAAEQLAGWYGQAAPTLPQEEREVAYGVARLLRGDAGVRALIAWAMGWGPAQAASDPRWMAPYLTFALGDPYDAVRWIGARSLRTLPGFEDFDFDPLAGAEARIGRASEIIPRWAERHGADLASFPAAVLADPVTGLRQDVVMGLLSRRDRRPIMLSE